MKRRVYNSGWTLLLLILVGALDAAAATRRPHHRLAVEQIEVLEDEWRQAQLNDDVAAMDRLLSDDFLGITAAGKVVTKVQQLDRMRTRKIMLKQFSLDESKIKLVGSIAIVTTLARIDGTNEGKPLQGSFRYTQIYQKTGGAWRITSFEATQLRSHEAVFATTQSRNTLPRE